MEEQPRDDKRIGKVSFLITKHRIDFHVRCKLFNLH